GRLRVRRHGDVENLDVRISKQFGVAGMHASDVMTLCRFAGPGGIARGDGHGIEASLAIRHEVAIAHDEASAGTTDADVPAAGESRQVVESQVQERDRHGQNYLCGSTTSSK